LADLEQACDSTSFNCGFGPVDSKQRSDHQPSAWSGTAPTQAIMFALRRFAQLRPPCVGGPLRIRVTGAQSFRGLATFDDCTELIMPALSPTMTHGGLLRWHLKEGDAIEAGSAICEIETDKASMDYEAQDDGFLAKIIVQEGATDVKVGTVIGLVVEEKEMVEEGAFLTWFLCAYVLVS
jgi:hypothetical protein